MANTDQPPFASPVLAKPAGTASAATSLRDETGIAITSIRAAADSATAAELKVGFGQAARTGDLLVVGIRPGEWQLIGPAESVAAAAPQADGSEHLSLIDITHGRVVIRVSGHHATGILEKVCSLDWSDGMTPDGAAVSASVAKVGCDIIRDDAESTSSTPSYLLTCDRSNGQYLFDSLVDAGTEFGIAIH